MNAYTWQAIISNFKDFEKKNVGLDLKRVFSLHSMGSIFADSYLFLSAKKDPLKEQKIGVSAIDLWPARFTCPRDWGRIGQPLSGGTLGGRFI